MGKRVTPGRFATPAKTNGTPRPCFPGPLIHLILKCAGMEQGGQGVPRAARRATVHQQYCCCSALAPSIVQMPRRFQPHRHRHKSWRHLVRLTRLSLKRTLRPRCPRSQLWLSLGPHRPREPMRPGKPSSTAAIGFAAFELKAPIAAGPKVAAKNW